MSEESTLKLAVRLNWGISQDFVEPFPLSNARKEMFKTVLSKGQKIVLLSVFVNKKKYDVLFDGVDVSSERVF